MWGVGCGKGWEGGGGWELWGLVSLKVDGLWLFWSSENMKHAVGGGGACTGEGEALWSHLMRCGGAPVRPPCCCCPPTAWPAGRRCPRCKSPSTLRSTKTWRPCAPAGGQKPKPQQPQPQPHHRNSVLGCAQVELRLSACMCLCQCLRGRLQGLALMHCMGSS